MLSIVTIAICYTTWDDQIFDKPAKYVQQVIGNLAYPKLNKKARFDKAEFLVKPIWGCYVCATFWWGFLQTFIYGWDWYLCLPAMGISAVISMFQND